MDEMANRFQGLMEAGREDTAQIEAVKLLIQKDKSLALKTEIGDPLRLSIFDSLVDFLKDSKMKCSATFMAKISEYFKTYMVSKNRKSREEVIKALSALRSEKLEDKKLAERLIERR